jgi:O-antigen/teichoic acid export membrane protein
MPLPQPNRRKAFFVNLAGGWLGNSVLIIQGLVFIPLYINQLGSELYGFWLATGGVLAWFAMVDVGAAAVTQQRCAAAYGREDLQGVVDYLWHGLAVMLLVGLVFTVLVLLGANAITGWLGIPPEAHELVTGCFLLAACGTYSYLFSLVFRAFCSGLQRNAVHSAANLLGAIVAIAVIYVTLVQLDWGLWAIPAGNLARQLFELITNAAYSAYLLHRIETKPSWRKQTFQDYRQTTTALLAAKASSNFANALPNVLLTKLIGPEATVLYTVTMRPIQLVGAFINRANSSLFAAFSHYNADPSVNNARYKKLGKKVAIAFGGGCATAVLLYCLLNKPFIHYWVGPEKFAGQLFTALAATASFLLFKNNLWAGLLKAGLICVGIQLFGLIGVPIAMIIAGVPTQFLFHRIINAAKPAFAKPLALLNWTWIPLGGLAVTTIYLY